LNLIEVILAQGSRLQPEPVRGAVFDMPTCHRPIGIPMAYRSFRLSTFQRSTLAAAALCTVALPAAAQGDGGNTVTVTGRSSAGPAVGGFADQPLARTPLQASVFGTQQLNDAGIQSIGGLTRLDASVSDAYNAEGYWSILSVRGYTLDNRGNYRRDGLPINAETAIALDNKERLEVLKGTSGIQAGTSAPGGLVNLVTKRPTGPVRSARIEVRESGTVLGAVDIGDRFGAEGRFGLRLNAAYEHLDPKVRDSEGHRSLIALAGDWRLGADTLIEGEIEDSRQSQPSVAGFSMLGNSVPDAKGIDPRINLNHQPWGQPVVMDGTTASLRVQQRLNEDWRFTAHAMTQRLKSDDRTAFPYGVYDANYECAAWCDRYAPDGSFSYWQYISDNERRTSDALDLSFSGKANTAGISHTLQTGVLLTRYRGRFQDQVFDLALDASGNGDVGIGNIDGTAVTSPSYGYPDANTNRDERSTEFYLRDAMRLAESWQLWAGLRHTRMERDSVRTSADSNGSLRATSYKQNATLPWLALSYEVSAKTMVYTSWGEGLETEVAPNRPRYTNRGEALPALKSRQFEVGIKHAAEQLDAALTAFDIDRPQAVDAGPLCASGDPDSCTRQVDGSARHRGLEGQLGWRQGAWTWQASAMLLDAERRDSERAGVNGLRPVNVPRNSLRVSSGYRVAALPGLELQAALAAESDRMVLPDDNSVRIPGWARVDLGARWRQDLGSTSLTWRVGVDNVADRKAWKESPYQFGHVYLYPLQARTWRGSVQASF
jgi:iron complex outermembrane recepter protein